MSRQALSGLSVLPAIGSRGASVDITSLSSNVRVSLQDTASSANVVEVYGVDDATIAGVGAPSQGKLICRLMSGTTSFQINNDDLPSQLVFYRTAGADSLAPVVDGEVSVSRVALSSVANLATAGGYAASTDVSSLSRMVRVSLPQAASVLTSVDVYGFDDAVLAGSGAPIGGTFLGRLKTGAFSMQLNNNALPSFLVFYRTAGTGTIAPIVVGVSLPTIRASVSTVTDLAALSVSGYDNGAVVTTGAPNATWRLNRAFVGVVLNDPLRYVYAHFSGAEGPGDNGVWVRDIDAGEAGADNQDIWTVNPSGIGASDSNASSGTLASINEVLNRIGKQPIDGSQVGTATINLSADDITENLTIDVKFANDGALAIVGTKTVISTHTITAVTPYNSTTGVIGQYTISGAPDLSTRVGKFVRISSGPRLGNKTPIAKAISAGVFRGNWADQDTGAVIEPQVGDAVELYSITRIMGDVRINSSASGTGGGIVYFQDCEIGTSGSSHSVIVSSGQATFIACRLYGLDFYRECSIGALTVCHVTECRSYGFVFSQASTFASASGTALSARGGGVVNISTRSLIQGGGGMGALFAGHVSEGPGHVLCSSALAIVDYDVPAIQTSPGSTVRADEVITLRDAASGNFGIVLASGSGFYYATGKPPVIVGTVPPTSDYKVGGTNKAKAAIPYFEVLNGACAVINQ